MKSPIGIIVKIPRVTLGYRQGIGRFIVYLGDLSAQLSLNIYSNKTLRLKNGD